MLKQRNYNEMATYILDKIRKMDISENDKKALFAYITSLETKYFMEMENAQRWIPCSERLPEKSDDVVLITVIEERRIRDIYMMRCDEVESAYIAKWISAWMPLPEPYKGESDD